MRTTDMGTGGTGHRGLGQASWRRWHLSRQGDLLVEGPSHTPLLTRHIPAVPALPPAPAQGSWALWRRGALCSLVESCPWWPWQPGHPAGSTNPIQPPLASGTGTEPQAGGQRARPPIPVISLCPQLDAGGQTGSISALTTGQAPGGLRGAGGGPGPCLSGAHSPAGHTDVGQTATVQCDRCREEGRPWGREGWLHLAVREGCMESGLKTWSFQEDMWPPSAHAAATRAQPQPKGSLGNPPHPTASTSV